MTVELTVLEYLQRQIDGTLPPHATFRMNYPTAISRLLGFRVVSIGKAHACLEMGPTQRSTATNRARSMAGC